MRKISKLQVFLVIIVVVSVVAAVYWYQRHSIPIVTALLQKNQPRLRI
ncbi:hypothetical protein [Candidatus Enterovibrio escicola]|nr:hypothetical protein [Candidatus Enterovibrio escacola]